MERRRPVTELPREPLSVQRIVRSGIQPTVACLVSGMFVASRWFLTTRTANSANPRPRSVRSRRSASTETVMPAMPRRSNTDAESSRGAISSSELIAKPVRSARLTLVYSVPMTVAPRAITPRKTPRTGTTISGTEYDNSARSLKPMTRYCSRIGNSSALAFSRSSTIPGARTNAKGTIALFSDSENAFTPVSNGSDLATPLAA